MHRYIGNERQRCKHSMHITPCTQPVGPTSESVARRLQGVLSESPECKPCPMLDARGC